MLAALALSLAVLMTLYTGQPQHAWVVDYSPAAGWGDTPQPTLIVTDATPARRDGSALRVWEIQDDGTAVDITYTRFVGDAARLIERFTRADWCGNPTRVTCTHAVRPRDLPFAAAQLPG